jgi:hypothetical protein
MAVSGKGKMVPSATVLTSDLSETLEARLHRQITEQALREAGIEKVAASLQEFDLPQPDELRRTIGDAFLDQIETSWRAAIDRVADQLLVAQRVGRGLQEDGA